MMTIMDVFGILILILGVLTLLSLAAILVGKGIETPDDDEYDEWR